VLGDHLERRRAFEHESSGQQVVGDASKRIDVGPAVHLLAQCHLRRHIRRRSRRKTGSRRHRILAGQASNRFDQPKVEHLHEVLAQPYAPHVNVRRLDVTMHQSTGVSFFQ
jgi:hypothetical protein